LAPVVIAAISALRKPSTAALSEISAAHGANSASADACLSIAEPTATDVHSTAPAADAHSAATATGAHSAATATGVHSTATATAVRSTAAAAPLGQGRGCYC
jgi:hypothetical protein